MANQNQPQWIAKMYAGKTGRDHLGLGSVSSDRILPSLSPSINVLTIHPRYHSFYAFLLDEYWQRDIPRSRETWKEFFRPRDFLFSLGAHLCENPEHGEMRNIVGGQTTSGLAALAHERQKYFSYDADYIKGHFGGYGLYYRSVMAEMGIIYPGGQGLPYPVDVPSPYGKMLAASYRETIKNTEYYKNYFDGSHMKISVKVIKDYIKWACLCQLKTSNAPDRQLVLDTFLHQGSPGEPEARRRTFRMILDIANQTARTGISEYEFRQLLYFGKSVDGIRYLPTSEVYETYLQWRLYQAREYYSYALNGLWHYFCDWGIRNGGDYTPLPMKDFWSHLEKAIDFRSLAKDLGVPSPKLQPSSSFNGLLDWLCGVMRTKPEKFDVDCSIKSPINEHRIYELARRYPTSPHIMTAGLLTLFALVALRFTRSSLRQSAAWEVARMGQDVRLSMDLFLRKLETYIKSDNPTIAQVTHWLFENDVILQHELVATSKLPENTFRFQRDGDRIQFYNLDNAFGFSSARFEALSTTVYELGLCGDLSQPDHMLKQDGMTLLQQGDL